MSAKASGNDEPLELLAPDPDNPRFISDEALAGLEVSLAEHGDIAGMTWNVRTGQFVAGHQRLVALKRAGATTWRRLSPTRGVIVHPKTGAEFFVRIVDWTPEQQRVANLVANNPHVAGDFTAAALEQLRALEDDALKDSLRLGELEEELRARFEIEPDEPAGGNTDPDAVPEPPKEPITRPGDLWVLGEHRILCGDSTKAADVARLMDGEKAAVMNTDPPYGINYTAVKGNDGKWGDIANDTVTDGAELQAFLEAAIRTAVPHLRPDCAFYLWHPMLTQGTFFAAAAAAAAADVLIHRQIIWVKPSMILTRSGMYHWRHELCFYGWVRGNKPPWYGPMNQTSVIEMGRDGDAQHPTQKPVALFEFPMHNHTRKGEVCFEPFSGSGSQIIAAERLGRRCFALELEPRYVDVAVSRWEAFTGRTAECHHAESDPVHGSDDLAF